MTPSSDAFSCLSKSIVFCLAPLWDVASSLAAVKLDSAVDSLPINVLFRLKLRQHGRKASVPDGKRDLDEDPLAPQTSTDWATVGTVDCLSLTASIQASLAANRATGLGALHRTVVQSPSDKRQNDYGADATISAHHGVANFARNSFEC